MSGRICIFHKRLVHGFFLFYHSKPLNSTHTFLKKAGKCLTIQKFTQKKQRKSIFSLFYDKSLKLSFSNSSRYSLYMEGFPFTHTVLRPEASPVEPWRPICPRNGTGPTSGGPYGSRCAAGAFPAETARRRAALRGTGGTQHFHSSSLVIPFLAPCLPGGADNTILPHPCKFLHCF